MPGPTRIGTNLVYSGSNQGGTPSGTYFIGLEPNPSGGYIVITESSGTTTGSYAYQSFSALGAATSGVIAGPANAVDFSLSHRSDGTLLASVVARASSSGPFTETVSAVAADGTFTLLYSASIPTGTGVFENYPYNYSVAAATTGNSFAVLHQTGSSGSLVLDVIGANNQVTGTAVIDSDVSNNVANTPSTGSIVTPIEGGRYLVTWDEYHFTGTADQYGNRPYDRIDVKGTLVDGSGTVLSAGTTLATVTGPAGTAATSFSSFSLFYDVISLPNSNFVGVSLIYQPTLSGTPSSQQYSNSAAVWSTAANSLSQVGGVALIGSSTTASYVGEEFVVLGSDRLLHTTGTQTFDTNPQAGTSSGSHYSLVGQVTDLNGTPISDAFTIGAGASSNSSTSVYASPLKLSGNYFAVDDSSTTLTGNGTSFSYTQSDTIKLFDASTITTTHDDVMRIPLGTGEYDGGAGRDVAQFALASSAYSVVRSGADTVVVGDGLVARLSHMEALRFADRDVRISATKSDFNGDGTNDIVLQNGGAVVTWTMADGHYQSGRLITDGATGYAIVGKGDVNGDGTNDILLQNGGSVVSWTMKDGAYESGRLITDGATGYQVTGTGDFNGDGTADIMLQNGGSIVAWTMKNGAYESGRLITEGAIGYHVVGTGDFNGDGTDDVLLQNGGVVVEWTMKNGAYESGRLITDGAAGYNVVGIGDFNGDGTADVLLQNGGTVVAWTMKDGAYLSGAVLTTGATGYDVRAIGDVNGDGTDDIVLQNGGTVVDWLMKDGAYLSGSVLTSGLEGYHVV